MTIIKNPKIDKTLNVILYALLIITPIFAMLIACGKAGVSFANLHPALNDENWYYLEAKNLAEGGNLGYFGFLGQHAKFGGGSAHTVFNLIFYIIAGKIFGFSYNIIQITNLVLLVVSLLIFVLLVKPNKLATCILSLFIITSPMIGYYSMIAMSETLNFSFMITCAGLIYYLINNKDAKLYKTILVLSWIFVVYITLCRICFAIFVVPLTFITLRNLKMRYKILLSIVFTLACMGAYYLYFSLFCSKYVLDESLFSIIKTEGLFKTIGIVFKNLKTNLIPINVKTAQIITTYLDLYLLMAFIVVAFICNKINKIKLSQQLILINAAFILVGFIFGLCLLYNYATYPTLCRLFYCAEIFAVFMLLSNKNFTISKNVANKVLTVFAAVCLCASVSYKCYYNYYKNDTFSLSYTYFNVEQTHLRIETIKTEMLSKIKPDKNKSRWENTLCYFDIDSLFLIGLPAGISINLIDVGQENSSWYPDNDYAKVPAKYVIVNEIVHPEVYNHYLESNYSLLGQWEDFRLLVNNIYS